MEKAELRVFIANAKDDGEERLRQLSEAIEIACRKAFPNREPKITTGRDDFVANKARCGSWDAWGKDVAVGIHPVTREPRYHTIVVPTRRVGAGTAGIVLSALGIGKPVLRWDSTTGVLTRATACVKTAERDFKTGWEVG